MRKTVEERIAALTDKRAHDDCWNWIGATDRHGYAVIKVNGRTRTASRVLYLDIMGNPWSPVVRHKCDNPKCMNGAHLIGGTQKENLGDAKERGRLATGERNGNSKLTTEKVKQIKERGRKEHLARLANEYGVSVRAITKILKGETWAAI